MRGPYGVNATWPLAVLLIDPAFGITVSARGILGNLPGLGPVSYPWGRIKHAERVKGLILGTPGVRIVGDNLPRVVFWTWRPQEVLLTLAAQGVSVRDESDPPAVRIWP
jgi:hypothetical protein